MQYPVVKYTDYAQNFFEFQQKYPVVRIQQCNQAISPETFGNKSTGCGNYDFETINFNNDRFYFQPIIYSKDSDSGYKVAVNIGVQFRKDANTLHLQLCSEGFIIGDGAYLRNLDFGLSASSIEFLTVFWE